MSLYQRNQLINSYSKSGNSFQEHPAISSPFSDEEFRNLKSKASYNEIQTFK